MSKTPEEVKKEILEEFDLKFSEVVKELPSGQSIRKDVSPDMIDYIRTALDRMAEAVRKEALTEGRVSVLRDFDNLCQADAFMGFTDVEWSAIRKFFALNKKISNWDK